MSTVQRVEEEIGMEIARSNARDNLPSEQREVAPQLEVASPHPPISRPESSEESEQVAGTSFRAPPVIYFLSSSSFEEEERGRKRRRVKMVAKYADLIDQMLGDDVNRNASDILLELKERFRRSNTLPDDWPGDDKIENRVYYGKRKIRDKIYLSQLTSTQTLTTGE